jgi:hypothetical protein
MSFEDYQYDRDQLQLKALGEKANKLFKNSPVEIGSVWRDNNGTDLYKVYDITNVHSSNPKCETTISYVKKDNTNWSKPLSSFLSSMTELPWSLFCYD